MERKQYLEKCFFCGGDVYYNSGDHLIKCSWCGQTLKVAKFESELARIKETEEENALVRQQLEQAVKDKEAADNRLFVALTSLGKIENDQDVLGRMLQLLTGKQENALEQLQFLKKISEQLISSQDDIFARMSVMNEIAARLQQMDMDAGARQSAMNAYMTWSQQIREEDLQRLQEIRQKTDTLLAGQLEIQKRVGALQEAADRHQQALEDFHGEYTKDKLEELSQLYQQAAGFQSDRNFEDAEDYYRKVLTKGGGDAEVYWRMIMCHYGISYQKDEEGSQIPIILKPDLTDPAEMSLRRDFARHLTAGDQEYYQAELEKIDRILDRYRMLRDQVQYDVFISVKQNTDGHYTPDSDTASDLYDFLTDQGLRVFNSRRTIIPAGQEYEPYIISALMSARAMIVVGTKPENMNAQWVKNEWSRFQWMQKE